MTETLTTASEDLTARAGRSLIHDLAVGALTGAAVGDAIGGATEGFSPAQIAARWGGWVTGVVEPYHANWRTARPISPYHKGDGNFTDDTIMTHLLAEVYEEQGRHLGAYDVADHLVRKILTKVMWIPEIEGEGVPVNRLFLAETYLALRLEFGNVDPREAGVGNMVNCGAAMYMAPVGVVNAGDPDGAYAEAIDIAGAHQSSYGREAAGVVAAAIAAAAGVGASLDTVFSAVDRLAKDGTRAAILAVLEATASVSHWTDAIESGVLRDAVRPYDTVGEEYRKPGLGARRPSRVHSIEELPIALGMLAIAKGDARDAIIGGVNYGRDSDSIASMAGAIAGALNGAANVPADLLDAVATASKTDLVAPALRLADATIGIRRADRARAEELVRGTEALFPARP
jgi:ADP-ribosylglycohydrolase